MGIRFQCPNGHPLNVKDYLAGRRAICPECEARFFVPSASGGQAVPAPRQPVASPSPPVPTTHPAPVEPRPVLLWYTRGESGHTIGPVETEVIRQWLVEGRVSAQNWVWRTGWPEWRRAGAVFVEMLHQPPQLPPDTSASGPAAAPASAGSGLPPNRPHTDQQPVRLNEPVLTAAAAGPALAHRSRTGRRKKQRLQITFWLTMAVVLLMVALLWVLLR